MRGAARYPPSSPATSTRSSAPTRTPLVAAGFVDALRSANPHAVGPTVLQRVDAAKPTVSRRIDFVFVLPGANGVPRGLDSRVVLDIPRRRGDGTTLWPSDHYGVLADIDIWTNGVR